MSKKNRNLALVKDVKHVYLAFAGSKAMIGIHQGANCAHNTAIELFECRYCGKPLELLEEVARLNEVKLTIAISQLRADYIAIEDTLKDSFADMFKVSKRSSEIFNTTIEDRAAVIDGFIQVVQNIKNIQVLKV